MADMVIGGKPLGALSIVKIRPGEEGAAKAAARKNGADDVFVRLGEKDVYVASGRGFDSKAIKPGFHAKLGALEGYVLSADEQVNTTKDGLKAGAKIGGIAIGATAAVGTVGSLAALHLLKGGGTIGAVLSAFLLMGAAYVGAWFLGGSAVGLGGATAAGGIYGKRRDIDLEALKAHGQVVPDR